MPLWFAGIGIMYPIEIDYEAEPVAGDKAGKRSAFRFAVHASGPACLS